ncbi:MAG: transposase family protein [Candidatus Eremiobacteraeota bacterium]|nr:transposase family protein [Candidatus Eremiobacteraeota bacterium]
MDKDDATIAEPLQQRAQERPRWGWRRLLIMTQRAGVNGREFRFRRAETLSLRANERWSIDFIHDRLARGRNIRAIAVVDDFTRKCLVLELEFSFLSHDLIRSFEDIPFNRGLPGTIRFDNSSEFSSHAMLRWGAERSVQLPLHRPRQANSKCSDRITERKGPG